MNNIIDKEYSKNLWQSLKAMDTLSNVPNDAHAPNLTLFLPTEDNVRYQKVLKANSSFRQIATTAVTNHTDNTIYVSNFAESAQWTAPGGPINLYDSVDTFDRLPIDCHKLAMVTQIDEYFAQDAAFDFKSYFILMLAKAFSRAEDNAFVNGTGIDMPKGILHENYGAETGLIGSATNLSADDVIRLYFSLDKEYRKNASWMMNDDTLMALRSLKDSSGRFIFENDLLLGKPVSINNAMPSEATGTKPIAFGDFSYYWIVDRMPLSVRALYEKFINTQHIGYLAIEYLDGVLSRRDAIKVVQMA